MKIARINGVGAIIITWVTELPTAHSCKAGPDLCSQAVFTGPAYKSRSMRRADWL